jgi:hypothetical protein
MESEPNDVRTDEDGDNGQYDSLLHLRDDVIISFGFQVKAEGRNDQDQAKGDEHDQVNGVVDWGKPHLLKGQTSLLHFIDSRFRFAR